MPISVLADTVLYRRFHHSLGRSFYRGRGCVSYSDLAVMRTAESGIRCTLRAVLSANQQITSRQSQPSIPESTASILK
jgi:hypothetical protein